MPRYVQINDLEETTDTPVSLLVSTDGGYWQKRDFSTSAGGSFDYAIATRTSTTSLTLTTGDTVPFQEKLEGGNGFITFDLTGYFFTLAAGQTYELRGSLGGGRLGNTMTSKCQFYNITDALSIGSIGITRLNPSTSDARLGATSAIAYITTTVQTDVDLRLASGSTSNNRVLNATYAEARIVVGA